MALVGPGLPLRSRVSFVLLKPAGDLKAHYAAASSAESTCPDPRGKQWDLFCVTIFGEERIIKSANVFFYISERGATEYD